MFGYFYNQNLRKLVVGFGSLFSNIEISHKDPDTGDPFQIRVPVHYAPQEKFIQRLLQPSSITDGTRIEIQVPIISFMMSNISPDHSRKFGRYASNINQLSGGECQSTGNKIKTQIPVNVAFNLYAYTRHTDDLLQIIEQIMPYFVPDHIIKIEMNDVQNSIEIPIIMHSNSITEKYEGDFSSRRLNIASFQFIAKSWIFGEVQSITTISDVSSSVVLDFS
jgi:hypothetical protein